MFISIELHSLLVCQRSKYIVKICRLHIKKYVTQFQSNPVSSMGSFEKLAQLRSQASDYTTDHDTWGLPCRLDVIQCSIISCNSYNPEN